MKTRILLALAASILTAFAAEPPIPKPEQETQYLVFQVWPRMDGYPGIPALPGRLSLSKEQMEGFIRDVARTIGTKGDTGHKLGFAVGPFSFDVPDDETRQWIRDSFAVARENDVAVALHIDDSMSWGTRKELLANPDNIETADWAQIPNTARSLAWGVKPTKFPPQMCYNAPAIVAAARARAKLIGEEIAHELAVLKSQGKEHLFAAIIAGSETQISPEFGTNRRLGFRALAHRGFSQNNPPKDLDAERVSVVKEWIEVWCNSLRDAGAPREKIFCHIAFTDQGLRKPDAKESYAEKVHFAPPAVAFSSAYRPGFSTYPEGRTFEEVYAALAAHGSSGWISAEGTNVSPTSMPGEPTMETYLGRVFNHGGVLANVFSWGIGGEAMRSNFFRQATENPECLSAYAKFLRGEKLVGAGKGFSERFQEKMRRIQTELPVWMQKSGQQAQSMSVMQKIQSLAKERKWDDADNAADELLALMRGAPMDPKTEASAVTDRLPAKIQKIQKELPAWIQKTGNTETTALMQKMQEQLKARDWLEAEKTADAILKMMGVSAPPSAQGGENKPPQPPPASPFSDDRTKRLTAKVERVKAGAQKWAAGGRDPSVIAQAMEQKFKPLMEAGKIVEAEAELDHVLELLNQDAKTTAPAGDSRQATDPFSTGSFPPELVLLAQDRLALTPGQLEAFRARLGKTQQSSGGTAVAVADLLAPEQLAKLRELASQIANDHAVFVKLEEESSKRISAKAERVKAGVQKWVESGRDPSAIAQTMQGTVKPLLDAGKFVEAEAELDRVLDRLNPVGTSSEPPTTPTPAGQDIIEEVREKLAHNIGISFLLFRTKVQEELKVTKEQKAQLDQHLRKLLPDAMSALPKSKGEQAKFNQMTHGAMAAVLKCILSEGQRTRLRQLELQKDGLFGPAWNLQELQITDEQRQQFMLPTKETQQKSQALMAEIQKGANPDGIRPKALQLRLDLEVKLEALLTDAQKSQWKEMLGQPVALDVIYGGL